MINLGILPALEAAVVMVNDRCSPAAQGAYGRIVMIATSWLPELLVGAIRRPLIVSHPEDFGLFSIGSRVGGQST